MREIKFRGKRMDNGEWVEGYLLKQEAFGKRRSYIITGITCVLDEGKTVEIRLGKMWYEVNPETVEQLLKHEETYVKAIEKWGEDPQILMAIEELSELIQVLAKLKRKFNGAGIERLAEEIVDVEIMLSQIKIIFDSDTFNSMLSKFKSEKLERLKKLVGAVS